MSHLQANERRRELYGSGSLEVGEKEFHKLVQNVLTTEKINITNPYLIDHLFRLGCKLTPVYNHEMKVTGGTLDLKDPSNQREKIRLNFSYGFFDDDVESRINDLSLDSVFKQEALE